MNNIQFWIWVIVIVVTFLVRLRNKKKGTGRESSEAPEQPLPRQEESSKPMTFEELLKEIQAAKDPEPKPVPLPAKPFEMVDYDDDIEEEVKSSEKTDYNTGQRQQAHDIYEKAKAEAFSRPSLEETLNLKDTIVRFGQFKGYQHEAPKSAAAEFAREVKNPLGFKKAFIMSEILKRRF